MTDIIDLILGKKINIAMSVIESKFTEGSKEDTIITNGVVSLGTRCLAFGLFIGTVGSLLLAVIVVLVL